MVHFTRCRLPCLWIQQGIPRHDPRGVAPFGYRRINACLPLPDAFRSLPRPSSPVGAKASTVRPYELDPKGVETSSQIARTGLFFTLLALYLILTETGRPDSMFFSDSQFSFLAGSYTL